MLTQPDNIIVAQNISKTFKIYASQFDRVKDALLPAGKKAYHKAFQALDSIDFTITRGETVGLIGRNGSGKSTLLQIICGILKPSRGTILVSGRVSALLELGAGFNPEFSGRENVYLNAAILGLSREEIDERFEAIVDFSEIGEFIDNPVKTYSSGMYIRLAFAVAINVDPEILIVDEALAVGDTLFQAKCFAKFREFQKKGVTILFVTHSMDLITKYCSTALLLERGNLLKQGPAKSVVDEYKILLSGTEQSGAENGSLDDSLQAPAAANLPVTTQPAGASYTINPGEHRYGDGRATILEAGIRPAEGETGHSITTGGRYCYWMRVRLNEPLENPIFAYTIKDVKGFDITGTNTYYQEVETGTYAAGEDVIVEFEQKMILNPGGYLISFGCASYEENEYIVHERRYDMLSIEVLCERFTVGMVEPGSDITVRRLDPSSQGVI